MLGGKKPPLGAKVSSTLVGRLSRPNGVVDRCRFLFSKVGERSYRVFLVWTTWGGSERGEGDETEIIREEIYPPPRVSDMTSLNARLTSGGVVPQGSIVVTEISMNYTADKLSGRLEHEDRTRPKNSFFYELVEDGRADREPQRMKMRLACDPFNDAENIQWVVRLDHISEDRNRKGVSRATEED